MKDNTNANKAIIKEKIENNLNNEKKINIDNIEIKEEI